MSSRRLSFRVPAARQDELIAELWSLGTSGVHLRPVDGVEVVDAYFDGEVVGVGLGGQRWAICGAELIADVDVADEDWLANYRASARPFRIGPFRVDPREPETAAPGSERAAGRLDLRIPARNAFGTGSHESTRLVLELLPGLHLEGHSLLDVGTGSGILAFAALRLGARRVVGFDFDVASVAAARDNAFLNRLAPWFFAGRVEAVAARFDAVVVNILPDRWLPEADDVIERLAPGGDLIVSGLLTRQQGRLRERVEPLGLTLRTERSEREWSALHFVAESRG